MNLKIRRTQAMNNFWQRTLTGIAFVAVILTSIYFQDKYFIFTGIFGLVNILALYEFYKITNISDRVNVPTIYLIICGTILYFGCFWFAKYGGEIVIVCYAMCIVALLIAELYRKKAAPTHNIAFSCSIRNKIVNIDVSRDVTLNIKWNRVTGSLVVE